MSLPPLRSVALSKRVSAPANIYFMRLSEQRLANIRPVSVLDIFDGSTDDLHSDGLFSTEIFGRVGSEERDLRFSYIDVKVEVFHPFIYKTLVQLKGLYKTIMSGHAYAIWDDNEKDFIASDLINGDTGFHFFFKHWHKIIFKKTESKLRDARIEVIEKAKREEVATTRYIMVIPAGLRDVQVEHDGRVKVGEINDFYRPIINASNAISASSDLDTPIINTSRNTLQNNFNLIFDYLSNLLDDKGGFIQAKWGRRHLANGTRNVITAMATGTAEIGAVNTPNVNSLTIGLYQLAKAANPKTKHWLLTGWLAEVFSADEGRAFLVNPKSYKRELVDITANTADRWRTTSGLDKVISMFGNDDVRLKPIMIENYYLGLIYKGPDMTFKIFNDIDDLPEHLDRSYVEPLTLTELIYLAGYKDWNKIPMTSTRYPITGAGSIFVAYAYCKTTVKSEVRYELGADWNKLGEEFKAIEFPILNDSCIFIDSLIPHPSRLKLAGGDFDGDMMSANAIYLDESVAEVNRYLRSKAAYVDAGGKFMNSSMTDTVERVLFNMSGKVE